MPPDLRLPVELGQRVLDYLAQRPYAEVYQLILALQQLEPLEQPAEDEPE